MIGTNARKKLRIGKIFTGLSKAEYQELVGDILHDGLGSYSIAVVPIKTELSVDG